MNFYAGQKPGADKLYALSYADTYVPTLDATTTTPNLGADGSITGWYHRNGLWISGGVLIHFSGTGVAAGSGFYEITLPPFEADTSVQTATTTVGGATSIGHGQLRDGTGPTISVCTVILRSAILLRVISEGVATVTDASPWTWASGDRISIGFGYVADPAGLPFGT